MKCNYCGNLSWTIGKYGRVVHKEQCPNRKEEFHRGNPPSQEQPKELEIKLSPEMIAFIEFIDKIEKEIGTMSERLGIPKKYLGKPLK